MAQPPFVPPQSPGAAAGPAYLPLHARERLTAMRQTHFFTSDLSVNEFLLVKEVGFAPAGPRDGQQHLPHRLPPRLLYNQSAVADAT